MVIAGLCAEGVTEVEDVYYIERGYEDMIGKLRGLGADIACVSDPDEPPQTDGISAAG
jgi:UDP-N-acetylglucosamine 1-carboxyvinyltransferase